MLWIRLNKSKRLLTEQETFGLDLFRSEQTTSVRRRLLDNYRANVGCIIQERRTKLVCRFVEFIEFVAAGFLLCETLSRSGEFILSRCVAGVFFEETFEDLAAFLKPLEAVQLLGLAGKSLLRGPCGYYRGIGIGKGSSELLGFDKGDRSVEAEGAGFVSSWRAVEASGVAAKLLDMSP